MKAFSSWERKTFHQSISYTRMRAWLGGLGQQQQLAGLTNYVLFIGYPRSGHSIVGALLDAHPNVVISNELDSLLFFEHGYTKAQIAYLIEENARQNAQKGRSNTGYNYAVPGQWQGRHQTISVIGDKDGGGSSRKFVTKGHTDRLERVKSVMGVPIKIIHIVRNPFDNLSTIISRTMQNSGQSFSEYLWDRKVNIYTSYLAANQLLMNDPNYDVLTMSHEAFSEQPAEKLKELCAFIGVEALADYVEDCAAIVWNKPSQSRYTSDIWTPERIEQVANIAAAYPFLQPYNY